MSFDAELKTSRESCQARRVEPDYENLKQPGDFYYGFKDGKPVQITIWQPGLSWWVGTITINIGESKEPGPIWTFNGNLDKPTLAPSIKTTTTVPTDGVNNSQEIELWHGHMENGFLKSC